MEIVALALAALYGILVAVRYLGSADAVETMNRVLADEDASPASNQAVKKASKYPRKRVISCCIGAALFASIRAAAMGSFGVLEICFGVLGAVAGDLLWKRSLTVRAARLKRRMEYSLPIVMERMVMAVGAGLDIHPALMEVTKTSADPVSERLALVAKLCDRGLGLKQALEQVSATIDCPPVKHAFVHLGLAQSEGGELVRPLRELSDATQAHYQETIEEEIAKLPAKAVLPLVVTFTGLIVCFLTVPLIQVSTMVKKVAEMQAP